MESYGIGDLEKKCHDEKDCKLWEEAYSKNFEASMPQTDNPKKEYIMTVIDHLDDKAWKIRSSYRLDPERKKLESELQWGIYKQLLSDLKQIDLPALDSYMDKFYADEKPTAKDADEIKNILNEAGIHKFDQELDNYAKIYNQNGQIFLQIDQIKINYDKEGDKYLHEAQELRKKYNLKPEWRLIKVPVTGKDQYERIRFAPTLDPLEKLVPHYHPHSLDLVEFIFPTGRPIIAIVAGNHFGASNILGNRSYTIGFIVRTTLGHHITDASILRNYGVK